MMTKENLRNAWGHYCDTDKIVDDMMALLSAYHHRNSEHGVCTILNKYFTNKEPIIKLLMSSGSYVGDLRIILKKKFARETVANDVYNFVYNFRNDRAVRNSILSYRDEQGKKMTDYLTTGKSYMKLKDIKKAQNLAGLEKFNLWNGATTESAEKEQGFMNYMYTFGDIYTPLLQQEYNMNGVKLHKGLKTSRAFNKVCAYYGVDKCNKYNKEFAKYADMVSGKERELYYIISVNPLDYLTMSFGNSWASCHTIDKRNKRNMPNNYSGQYCNGTLSYMMDESSIVTYVVDELRDNLHEQGRLYRNMFHLNLNGKTFVQGRVYPQGCDGSTDLYKKFREYVQEEFTPLLGMSENLWKVRNTDSSVNSTGYHYQDYYSYEDCRVFYPSEGSCYVVDVGAIGICPYCGQEYHTAEYLSHDRCNIE